jgi:hypothetical protein
MALAIAAKRSPYDTFTSPNHVLAKSVKMASPAGTVDVAVVDDPAPAPVLLEATFDNRSRVSHHILPPRSSVSLPIIV